jgi:rhodanese-related sulfurtransferase/glyoxylase-like metal-dependent hydrolase (beta-lactamase superfamily II)
LQFERFWDDVLAQASYLIGDEGGGIAAVVDPRRDIDVYVDAARARGLKLKYAILTQTPTSFVAGHLDLRDREAAQIVVGRRASVEFDARRVGDGDEISLGPDVRLTFLEASGRSDDALVVLVQDRARGPSPWAAIVGEALPIEGAPHPDLALTTPEELPKLAFLLHGAVQGKLLALPDSTRIYPASLSGTSLARAAVQGGAVTLGQVRVTNAALSLPEASFVQAAVVAAQVSPPAPWAAHAARRNREEHPSIETILEDCIPLDLDVVLNALAKGALLVDARPGAEHAAGHMRGALAVPLDGRFAPWVGSLVPPTRPLILLAPDGRAMEAAVALARIGHDSIWGHVRGGMAAFRAARPDLVARTALVAPTDLAGRRDILLVDVRSKEESQARRIPGSLSIPIGALATRAPGEIPRERLIVLYDDSGRRATTAASVLERVGLERLAVLDGGLRAWEDAHLPVEGKDVAPARPERA